MKGNIFSTPKKARIFVYEEIFILLLAVIQLYKVFGMKLTDNGIEIFATPVLMQSYLWFAATIFVLLIVYFGIAKKDKTVMKMHKDFSKIVLGTGKEKVFGMEREVVVLLFIEFIFEN